MNAVILTAIHGRHAVASAMLRHCRTLSQALAPRHTIRLAAVLSPGDEVALSAVLAECEVAWCVAQNRPVSWKWQRGLDMVRAMDYVDEPLAPGAVRRFRSDPIDAVVIFGSDDFATPAYLAAALDVVQSGAPGVGPDSCWMFDAATGNLGRWQGPQKDLDGLRFPCGAGRVLSRALLERIGWLLWPFRKDEALDMGSWDVLRSRGGTLDLLDVKATAGAAVVDFKNGENIHPWNRIPFREIIGSVPARDRLASWGMGFLLDLPKPVSVRSSRLLRRAVPA